MNERSPNNEITCVPTWFLWMIEKRAMNEPRWMLVWLTFPPDDVFLSLNFVGALKQTFEFWEKFVHVQIHVLKLIFVIMNDLSTFFHSPRIDCGSFHESNRRIHVFNTTFSDENHESLYVYHDVKIQIKNHYEEWNLRLTHFVLWIEIKFIAKGYKYIFSGFVRETCLNDPIRKFQFTNLRELFNHRGSIPIFTIPASGIVFFANRVSRGLFKTKAVET